MKNLNANSVEKDSNYNYIKEIQLILVVKMTFTRLISLTIRLNINSLTFLVYT